MGILDPDRVERELGKSVQEMDDVQLLTYCQEMFKLKFGYPLVIDEKPERAVLKRLLRLYKRDAGLIIKWVFHRYGGQWTSRGKTTKFSILWFQRRYKDWVDQMYNEVQGEKRRLENPGNIGSEGFGTTEGFI